MDLSTGGFWVHIWMIFLNVREAESINIEPLNDKGVLHTLRCYKSIISMVLQGVLQELSHPCDYKLSIFSILGIMHLVVSTSKNHQNLDRNG